MVRFSLIRPLDQPTGTRRLLHDLEAALDDDRFTAWRLIAAYAKSGPLLRLQPRLTAWRRGGAPGRPWKPFSASTSVAPARKRFGSR